MKILVTVKRVADAYVKIRVKADKTGVEQPVKLSMNPFDAIAVEEAVRIAEKHQPGSTEIVVVSIGDKNCQETLLQALALEQIERY